VVAIRVVPGADKERPYTIRLYFIEPDNLERGQRRFDVSIQGRDVLKEFDILQHTKAPRRGMVREFKGIKLKDVLTVGLARSGSSRYPPVLCGLEVIAERR